MSKSNQNVIGSPKNLQNGQGFSPTFHQTGPKSLKLESSQKSNSVFSSGILTGIDTFSPRLDQKVYTDPIARNRSVSYTQKIIFRILFQTTQLEVM